MVKERPILFSGGMVRAILDSRKTQTRRIWKMPRGLDWYVSGPMRGEETGDICDPASNWWGHVEAMHCPYGMPGDRLWVRETWQHSNHPFGPYEPDCDVFYRADYLDDPLGPDLERSADGIRRQWRPSIHMPRAACRLQLEITGVRVERLQDISDVDALAEGVEPVSVSPGTQASFWKAAPDTFEARETARGAFWDLWESINGNGAWETNPFVWVIDFQRL